jgi:hypothetical protein
MFKIPPLPDDLRASIQAYLADLDAALTSSRKNRAVITDEIATLESAATQLNGEIIKLQFEATSNDSAAAMLNTKETRLSKINQRLPELQTALVAQRPVALHGAAGIITSIISHYLKPLPEAIADALAPVCPTREKATAAAKLCDAWTALGAIRDWAYSVNGAAATADNVERLTAILNRALKGQAHLGVNEPEPEAEK